MARVPNPQVDAILLVVRELCGIREQLVKQNDNNAVLCRMAEMEKRIMEAIDTFATAVNASFETLNAAADSLLTVAEATSEAVTGISADVTFLKDEIKKLQDAPAGPWTPEDQAKLDAIQTVAATIATKVSGLSTTMTAVAAAASALDAATETPPALPEE